MAEFRNIIANGDLIRQKRVPRWWLFGDKDWEPFRNLSREGRYLETRMHSAHAAYRAAQEDFVVAQRNIRDDTNLIKAYKSGNSEVSFEIPSDESILSRREGVKYTGNSGNNSGKQNNQQKNGDNQQKSNNTNNNNSNTQQKGKQQQRKPVTLVELLMNTRVVTH